MRRDIYSLATSLAVAVMASTLATTAVLAQPPTPTAVTGNAERGATIVATRGACLTCHRVGDRGSRVGPNLSDIGRTRTDEQLQTALLDPNAEILPENRFYRVVTRDGETITGRLLNLDTFQVLMLDAKEQLRAFSRADLREQAFITTSMMPSSREALSRQEQEDVLAYLRTLKGPTPQ